MALTEATQATLVNSIGIFEKSSPVLIVIIETSPPCWLKLSQEVFNIGQSTSPGLVRQSQKLDAAIDRNLSNNRDSTSIFRKVVCEKLSNGSIQGLYTRFRMNLAVYTFQSHTPKLVDLGISTINALDEGSGLSTPATRIQRPMHGDHWSMPNNIFGETIAVGVSESESYSDYNYKTELQVWK